MSSKAQMQSTLQPLRFNVLSSTELTLLSCGFLGPVSSCSWCVLGGLLRWCFGRTGARMGCRCCRSLGDYYLDWKMDSCLGRKMNIFVSQVRQSCLGWRMTRWRGWPSQLAGAINDAATNGIMTFSGARLILKGDRELSSNGLTAWIDSALESLSGAKGKCLATAQISI